MSEVAVQAPDRTAPTQQWQSYAVDVLGASEAAILAMTRKELIAWIDLDGHYLDIARYRIGAAR